MQIGGMDMGTEESVDKSMMIQGSYLRREKLVSSGSKVEPRCQHSFEILNAQNKLKKVQNSLNQQ